MKRDGGRRSTKQDIAQLVTFIEEGLTTRQIAERLGRSEAGIRNLCYRIRLVRKAKDETKILFKQRDQLKEIVTTLQSKKILLTQEIDNLKREKEKLESIIYADKILLQQTIRQALENLKQQRPDLFYLTGQDQIVSLTRLFLQFIN